MLIVVVFEAIGIRSPTCPNLLSTKLCPLNLVREDCA